MAAPTSLHFHGPFTFVDHDGRGIAKSEFAQSQGIYLWVLTDGTSRYIQRSAYAIKRAADPMGRGRTTPAEIKKFKDATAAHDATKAEVARLRAKLPR